jgi:hypothetical protein
MLAMMAVFSLSAIATVFKEFKLEKVPAEEALT